MTVRGALQRLPTHQAEILERFFVRDESYQTIASVLDIPPGTIASRISRALAALREELER
jgi:RNA polymerase sigma-70 factor, ECF subfamily